MFQTILTWVFRLTVRLTLKTMLRPAVPVALQRRWTDAISVISTAPPDVGEEKIMLGGVETLKVTAPGGPAKGVERPALLWAHGGAFLIGSLRSHRGLACRIAKAAGADVYMPSYRLAPEHPSPAPSDDLFAAYRALLELGHQPQRLAIGGDSGGGALAITTALAIQDMDLARPAAMVLISPWTDLELTAESITTKASADPMLTRGWLEQGASAHAGPLPLTDPRVSPLYADLHGLPPTLVQVGSDEILLGDSIRFADRAWGAGVEVELQRFPGMWHNFQQEAPLLQTAVGALNDIGAFLQRRFDSQGG